MNERRVIPADDKARKALPIFDGVMMYFPDALLAVAHVSKVGNDQHNPGEPLHWAKDKSTDQMNTALRHLMDHGVGNPKDTDGTWHLAKAAWRTLAALQMAIENERNLKPLGTPAPAPRCVKCFGPMPPCIDTWCETHRWALDLPTQILKD